MQQHKPSVIEVCEFCKDHQLNAELVGRWVWVKLYRTGLLGKLVS